jgi:hypothetical protein
MDLLALPKEMLAFGVFFLFPLDPEKLKMNKGGSRIVYGICPATGAECHQFGIQVTLDKTDIS